MGKNNIISNVEYGAFVYLQLIVSLFFVFTAVSRSVLLSDILWLQAVGRARAGGARQQGE